MDFARARLNMVEGQIRPNKVTDPRIVAAMLDLPRERFLPPEMDEAGMQAAVRAAVAETGAASVKDMGKVMAALKAKHGASLDMAKAGPLVKMALAG